MQRVEADQRRLRHLRGAAQNQDAALKAKFPNIKGPAAQDICYATENRQVAVKQVASEADLLLVVGSDNSSNSNRLREIGEEAGTPSYLIADGNELDASWFKNAETVGITAGASAPEVLVEDVIEALRRLNPVDVSQLHGRHETIEFRLPPELTDGAAVAASRAAATI